MRFNELLLVAQPGWQTHPHAETEKGAHTCSPTAQWVRKVS